MIKLLRKTRRHFELRVEQEVLFELCCLHSQRFSVIKSGERFPRLEEYSRINQAVRRIDKLIPKWYWVLCLFNGNVSRLRKARNKKLEEELKNLIVYL